MIEELEKSIEHYDISSINGIHPISTTDAHIIESLTKILTETQVSQGIVEILEKWKVSRDDDVLKMLHKIEEEGVDSDEHKRTLDFIHINGNDLAVKTIFSIKSRDSYSQCYSKPIYLIVINETDHPSVVNGNIEIKFTDWADRDNCRQDLQEKLSKFTNIRFL